jgi:cobaltochelatase CobS subunit
MKHFFLTRNRDFLEAEILTDTPKKREIKILDKGHKLSGKTMRVPPEGVASGKLYPRVFAVNAKPTAFFEFNGRVLLSKGTSDYLVPTQESYRFQKVTSSVIDSILAHDKVLLTGEAGTGKTSMITQLASRINQPVLRVNLNGETRMADFIGRMNVVNGEKGSVTEWVDGILPRAMRNGYWLILDEVDFAQPEILSLLHPVLEQNGTLVVKENKGEEIKAHPNFRLFGTANSIGSMAHRGDTYSGTQTMNEAFMDRWHLVTVPNMDEKTEIKVLRERVPSLQSKFAKRIVQFANMIRKGKEGNVVNMTFSTRRVIQWGEKTALYRNATKGAESVFFEKVSPEDKAVLLKNIALVFGAGKRAKKVDAEGNPVKAEKPVVDPNAPKRKRGRPRKNP